MKKIIITLAICMSFQSCDVLRKIFGTELDFLVEVPIPHKFDIDNKDIYRDLLKIVEEVNFKGSMDETETSYQITIQNQKVHIPKGTRANVRLVGSFKDVREVADKLSIEPEVKKFELIFNQPISVIAADLTVIKVNKISSVEDNPKLSAELNLDIGHSLGLIFLKHVLKMDTGLKSIDDQEIFLPNINVDYLRIKTKPNASLQFGGNELVFGETNSINLNGFVVHRSGKTSGTLAINTFLGQGTSFKSDKVKVAVKSASIIAGGSFEKEKDAFSFKLLPTRESLAKVILNGARVVENKGPSSTIIDLDRIEVNLAKYEHEKKDDKAEFEYDSKVEATIKSIQMKGNDYNIKTNDPFQIEFDIKSSNKGGDLNFQVETKRSFTIPIEEIIISPSNSALIGCRDIAWKLDKFKASGWSLVNLSSTKHIFSPETFTIRLKQGNGIAFDLFDGAEIELENSKPITLFPGLSDSNFRFEKLKIINDIESLVVRKLNGIEILSLKNIAANLSLSKIATDKYSFFGSTSFKAYGGNINGIPIRNLKEFGNLEINDLKFDYKDKLKVDFPDIKLEVDNTRFLEIVNNSLPEVIKIPGSEFSGPQFRMRFDKGEVKHLAIKDLSFNSNSLKYKVRGRLKGKIQKRVFWGVGWVTILSIDSGFDANGSGNLEFKLGEKLTDLVLTYNSRVNNIKFTASFTDLIERNLKAARDQLNDTKELKSGEVKVFEKIKGIDEKTLNELSKIKLDSFELNTKSKKLKIKIKGSFETDEI